MHAVGYDLLAVIDEDDVTHVLLAAVLLQRHVELCKLLNARLGPAKVLFACGQPHGMPLDCNVVTHQRDVRHFDLDEDELHRPAHCTHLIEDPTAPLFRRARPLLLKGAVGVGAVDDGTAARIDRLLALVRGRRLAVAEQRRAERHVRRAPVAEHPLGDARGERGARLVDGRIVEVLADVKERAVRAVEEAQVLPHPLGEERLADLRQADQHDDVHVAERGERGDGRGQLGRERVVR
mmetsp:Transcript_11153/g.35184  ORF Transcript_11153/g.35184 Transcript_11153/m.35184 type:complete len:237 (-) Transcript_11153:117-827(-)